jgi:hypothetical protein
MVASQSEKGYGFDEVWNLVNKYYIDRSNGQDWEQVKEKTCRRSRKAAMKSNR